MVESKKVKSSFKAYEKKALIIINEIYGRSSRGSCIDLPFKEKQEIIHLFWEKLGFNTLILEDEPATRV